MPVLAWRNDSDGYAFVNDWSFDAAERGALTGIAQGIVPSVVATIAAIIPDPILLTALSVSAQAYTTFGPLSTYGLCGGMAYTALDHWNARVPIPRGVSATDNPGRTGVTPTAIRNSLWARLIDSLVPGGVLQRTIEWSLILNQIPAWFGGGAAGLKNRTVPEWDRIRSHIDAGRPGPIGLVYSGRDVWYQHQILVYGYEIAGPNQGKLYVCDSNSPAQFGNTNHTEINLDFRGPTLVADGGLAGFFCSNYFPLPPVGRAKSYGEFQRWTGDPRTFLVTGGARMPVANAAERNALGGNASNVRLAGTTFSPITTRPRDGVCLRELSSAPVFMYAGGSPFQIPDPVWMDRFGGFGQVRLVPDGTLSAFVGLPDEGTLLREWSDAKVWRIMSGVRRWVTSPAELLKWGGFPSVRVVPDGALSAIPEGQPLPTPNVVNECPSLRARIAALTTEIAQLEATIDTLEGRQLAVAQRRLLRAQNARATAQSRSAILQCA